MPLEYLHTVRVFIVGYRVSVGFTLKYPGDLGRLIGRFEGFGVVGYTFFLGVGGRWGMWGQIVSSEGFDGVPYAFNRGVTGRTRLGFLDVAALLEVLIDMDLLNDLLVLALHLLYLLLELLKLLLQTSYFVGALHIYCSLLRDIFG